MMWTPNDDDLDSVARSLPAPTRDAERVEQERTSLLAHAAGVAQQQRVSRAPMIAALATTFAAAAAGLIWFVARPSDPAIPKQTITAIGSAQFERTSPWPQFGVHLSDGLVAIHVARLAPDERLVVTTSDVDVEVHAATFLIGAEHDRVTFVSVSEGNAEVRWARQPPVIVAAGHTWLPPQIVMRETIELTPPAQRAASVALAGSPKQQPRTVERAPSAPADRSPEKATGPAKPLEATPKPQPPAPRPGEADFRAGVASLRTGDAVAATRSFAAACPAARGTPLAEDACFWLGAAAKRAGQAAIARDALAGFLATFPSSARAGEAAAIVGWILYDAGELDAAKQRFELASHDRVPKVKESALKGLEAIKRRQSAP